MIDYIVHGNKWVFLTIFFGAALVIIFVLTCWAMWRPREEEEAVTSQEITSVRGFFSWLVGIMPWAVILIIVGTAVYSIVHTVKAALKTPNW